MSRRKEYDNVVYAGYKEQKGKNYGELIGKEGQKELVEKLFKDKRRIKHRRKTLERCVGILVKDMYVQE